MNLELVLKQKLAQSLVMTQQMQQSIKILEMDLYELQEYINNLAMENPAIELDVLAVDGEEELRRKKKEWLERHTTPESYTFSGQYRDGYDPFAFEKMAAAPTRRSLAEHLVEQIDLHPTMEQKGLVRHLAHSLDEDGYLRMKLGDLLLACEGRFSEEMVEVALGEVRKLEPQGVGARTLAECLTLQLGPDQQVEREVAARYLEQAAKRQYELIGEKLGVEPQLVMEAYQVIQGLNPRPGSAYSVEDSTNYVTPDVLVTNFETHYDVLPCEFSYPSVHLSEDFTRLQKEVKENDETKQYMDEKIKQVEWIQQSIGNRTYTLVAVVKEIIQRQEKFFRYGVEHLNVLRMADIAEDLGMHESTVSRAVRGKYLQCFHGVYPLRFFFVQGIKTEGEDGEEASTHQIKFALKELVDLEDKEKPLSDQKLADLLAEAGYPISRRTVAKYRDELLIPRSGYRRE